MNLLFKTPSAMPHLPRLYCFFESEEYRRWVCSELGVPPSPADKENAGQLVKFLLKLPRLSKQEFHRISFTLVDFIGGIPECRPFFSENSWFQSFVEIVENLPACVYLSLPNTKGEKTVVYANNYTYECTGYSAAELLGRKCPFSSTSDPLDLTSLDRIKQAICRDAPVRAGVVSRRKDGSSFPSIFMSKPLLNIRGECRFVVSLRTDIVTAKMTSLLGEFIANIPNVVCDI